MIPSIDSPWQPNAWNEELRQAFRRPAELLEYLGLTDDGVDHAPEFAMLVPRNFAKRMQPRLTDPLLHQVLPRLSEQLVHPGFVSDPLAEHAGGFSKAPGLIQKYPGRALLLATPACAVNCRYCFRRHFPYAEQRPNQQKSALAYIASDASITEIILSGGDPLLMPDRSFNDLIQALNEIPHISRIRIHSRIPIVLPERTTAAHLNALANSRASIVLVTHANHPHELNEDTHRAFACYRAARVWLLNQAVLLKGVNNHADIQVELAHKLFTQGALPYYLHLPDRVAGTQHFYIDEESAQVIYQKMQATLPGYLVPRLVREDPGGKSKTLVNNVSHDTHTI